MRKNTQTNRKRDKDHDNFVRGIFELVELVYKLLTYALPYDLKPFIDFSTLKKSSDSHVSEKLKATYSDTIYEAKLNVKALPMEIQADVKLPDFRFCFLTEFKSSKPSLPIDFQLDDYARAIQRADFANNRTPSIIIPILIYHGVAIWETKRIYEVFAKYLPQTILNYVSFPKYIIIDLQALSDEDIAKAIDLGELRAAFLALKHAQDEKFFQQNLGDILKFVRESKPTLLFETYLSMLLEYLERRSGLTTEEFNNIAHEKIEEDMGAEYQSLFDRFYDVRLKKAVAEVKAEAKAEAKAEVKAEYLEKTKKLILLMLKAKLYSEKEIAEQLDVPLSLVQTVRQEMLEKK